MAQYKYLESKKKIENKLYSYTFSDTVSNTYYKRFFSDSGTIAGTAEFIGDTGIWTQYRDSGVLVDTVYTRLEKEAEFAGGKDNWTRHLEKYLRGYNPTDYGAGDGTWRVIVTYIVNEDGHISNIEAKTNFGHKM